MNLHALIELAADAAEIAGVALIAGGLVVASGRYAIGARDESVSRYQR